MTLRVLLTVALLCGAPGVFAADLALPAGASRTVERATELDSFSAPLGAFDGEHVPMQTLEGSVTRTAWRIDTGGLTSLQVMAPLRQQIEDLGYRIDFECESAACGGFDFRFAIEVLPGPNMYVNIASYRYLTAFKGPADNPSEALTVLASVTAASAYVQIINAVAASALAENGDAATPVPRADPGSAGQGEGRAPPTGDFLAQGFVILQDLEFATGTSELGAGPFASLAQLAEALARRPDLRVALVGHTDTVGDLAVNITLSRERARAVRTRLIDGYGIDASRLDAEGMGYLAPVATNLTPEGREQNRRVEAIVLNVE